MAKLKFRDENGRFIPVVQDVKVNGRSVFDGETADIEITEPDVDKEYVDSELDKKQDSLVSGEDIKTINGQDILGSGDINIEASEETPIIPFDVIHFDGKYGDSQFIELIGGLDNLERIKDAARDKRPITIRYHSTGDSRYIYYTVISERIDEYEDQGEFNLEVTFYHKYDNRFCTITISGRSDRDFDVMTSYSLTLNGQVSVDTYSYLSYNVYHNLPEGTMIYVRRDSNEDSTPLELHTVGDLIDAVFPYDYPLATEVNLQGYDSKDLTSIVILSQGENTVTVSYRLDPYHGEYNVFDWNIVKKSVTGSTVEVLHYIFIDGDYGNLRQGWNLYNETTGELEQISDISNYRDSVGIYGCRILEMVSSENPELNILNSIWASIIYRHGIYIKDSTSDSGWRLYTTGQPDFYEQDETSAAFIKNKPKIWIPELPNDTANKTYTLKLVDGVIQWIEEQNI